MSRYIDADKLLKSTISKYRCVPLVGIHSYRNDEKYFDGEDFDDLINNTPTADVVEVKVVSEIFKEIDKMLYKLLNDPHYIVGDMCWDVKELKNKYTEGKNNGN